jgi:aminoglycoside phosphotransferase (APT) family kinase protein
LDLPEGAFPCRTAGAPRWPPRSWQAALPASWDAQPVWFHGDAQPGNLIARDRRLYAVIDFGTCSNGDLACDNDRLDVPVR